jgi:hypothetical protein
MISINVIGSAITGSYGGKIFGVRYTKDKFTAMQKLEEAANKAASMDEMKKILDDFELLTHEGYKELVETACPDVYVNEATGKFYLKVGKVVTSIPMPNALVDRLKASIEKGIPFEPLIKFWTRWLRNPVLRKYDENGRIDFSNRMFNFINMTYTNHAERDLLMSTHGLSEETATELSTTYQVKITQEGLINGFKVSREIMHKYEASEDGSTAVQKPRYTRTFDPNTGKIVSEGLPEHVEDRLFEPAIMGQSYDAFSCEGLNGFDGPGHFIKVGCLHRLFDWNQVDCDNNRSCVKGLHFGGLDYISNYSGEIHNVFVDPMHVGAIPDDRTGAIRCLQYFVHSSLVGINGSIYHSSTYASKTDEQWKADRELILKEYGTLNDANNTEFAELVSL